MGLVEGAFAARVPERRAIAEWGTSAIPGPLGNMAGAGTFASIDLRRAESSLQKVAIWASIDLIAGLSSQLPLDTYRMQSDGTARKIGNSRLVADPGGEDHGAPDWIYQYLLSKLLRGNAYGQLASYDPRTAYPTQIVLYHPDDVKGRRKSGTGETEWYVQGKEVPAAEMWHRRSYPVPGQLIGLSPVGHHVTTIGQGMAAARFGYQFFTDGGHPSAMLMNSEEEIDQPKAAEVKAKWMSTVWGSREPVVMGRGWDYKALTVAPNESQFLETQKYTGAECCRIYGPNIAEILGYETGGSMQYSNIEQRAIDFLKFNLNRWLRDIEAVLTQYLPNPQFVKFKRAALLETDLLTRYRAHNMAIAGHWMAPSEVRPIEDMPPLTADQQGEIDALAMPLPLMNPVKESEK